MLVRLVTGEEEKVMTRKQKAESKENEAEQSPKKPKSENESGQPNGKDAAEIAAEFEEFCKATKEHLFIQQMREILEANGEDSSSPDSAIVSKCYSLTPT
nr:poly [adp-ribose] polymerase 3 [Quercus suber]